MATFKTVATNPKAYHEYFVLESHEAGIALTGSEIKSIRSGKVSLRESYVRAEGRELWLVNAHIARYEASSYQSHEPTRPRKLLMHRKQINALAGKLVEKGLTLVALKLYLKDSIAKVEVALAKGKRLHDKRDAIARREVEREMGRALRHRV